MMTVLCSIIISSFNKDGFVGASIESALSQTYHECEVIVVDDGSSDSSLQVLRAFGDRIQLVAKRNGGQASALNRGFAISRGEIVFFLDCDDLLMRDTVERVIAQWHPDVSKLHFRLQKIDGEGHSISGCLPPSEQGELPSGDLTPTLRRFGFYLCPPTSGNAYSRRFLKQIMPIPEDVYYAWPDTYLNGLAPLFGKIETLNGVGGCWRQSEGNYSNGNLTKLSAKSHSDETYIAIANQRFSGRLPQPYWPNYLKDRLIVAKFGSRKSASGTLSCSLAFIQSVLQWPYYGVRRKLIFVGWGLAMLIVPSQMLRKIPGIGGPTVNVTSE